MGKIITPIGSILRNAFIFSTIILIGLTSFSEELAYERSDEETFSELRKILKRPATGSELSSATCRAPCVTPSKKKSCDEVPISTLSVFGIGFRGVADCIDASSDTEAKLRCKPGTVPVNPGNPQYGRQGVGDLTSNTLGFYYCVPKKEVNLKQFICTSILRAKFGDHVEKVNIQWQANSVAKYDGDCLCGPRESASTDSNKCDLNKLREIVMDYSAEAARERAMLAARNPSPSTAAGQANGDWDTLPPAVAATSPTQTARPTAAAPTKSDLKTCTEEYAKKARICKEEANKAKATCTKVANDNKTLTTSGKLAGSLGDITTTLKQGSGSKETCFNASIMGSTAKHTIEIAKETCQGADTQCKVACTDDVLKDFMKNCSAKAGVPEDEFETKLENEDYEEIKSAYQTMQKNLESGKAICSKFKEQDIAWDAMLSDVGNALRNSLKCVCALSTGGAAGGDCNSIPPVEMCPNAPNCEVYTRIDICTPGAQGYNPQACNCMQNPSSSGCTTAGGGPGPNLFQGGNQLPSSFAGNIPTIGGGGPKGSSNIDLSKGGAAATGVDLSSLANQSQQGAPTGGSGGGGGFGGGGGGGGGSGGGAADPAAAAAAGTGEDKSGVGGLFTQVKNGILNAFGRGNNRNSNRPQAKGNGPDFDKYKPKSKLRGIANAPVLNSGSKEIWQIMNECSQGTTCKSNVNNYIDAP